MKWWFTRAQEERGMVGSRARMQAQDWPSVRSRLESVLADFAHRNPTIIESTIEFNRDVYPVSLDGHSITPVPGASELVIKIRAWEQK